MKYALIRWMLLCADGIYALVKLLPARRKLVFMSRQSNDASVDIRLLSKEISNQDSKLKQVILCKKLNKGLVAHLGYCFHIIRQMYHLSTSQIVILDGYCISASCLKHKDSLKIIQMWHALGALKKFGYSTLNMLEGYDSQIAEIAKMHRNYYCMFASSDKAKACFAEAFGSPGGRVIVTGLPRVDILRSREEAKMARGAILAEYEILANGKKNILYVPTFRKNSEVNHESLVDCINYDKYNLIVRLHDGKQKIYVDGAATGDAGVQFTGMKWLFVADYVVTDYSAIVFEAALLEKPLFFYAYDYEEYNRARSFYINYKEDMPGIISDDPATIARAIEQNNYDLGRIREFAKTNVYHSNEGCTKKMASLVLANLQGN